MSAVLNSSGVLKLVGTDGNDSLAVTVRNGFVQVTQGTRILLFPVKRVKSLLVNAGGGDDTVRVTKLAVPATVFAGDGNDAVATGDGDDTLYGSNGNDTLDAGKGNDVVYGEAGKDVISGNAGNDYLDGGDGADKLSGNAGNDVLRGAAGADTLMGGLGQDMYYDYTSADQRYDLDNTDSGLFGGGNVARGGQFGGLGL